MVKFYFKKFVHLNLLATRKEWMNTLSDSDPDQEKQILVLQLT